MRDLTDPLPALDPILPLGGETAILRRLREVEAQADALRAEARHLRATLLDVGAGAGALG